MATLAYNATKSNSYGASVSSSDRYFGYQTFGYTLSEGALGNSSVLAITGCSMSAANTNGGSSSGYRMDIQILLNGVWYTIGYITVDGQYSTHQTFSGWTETASSEVKSLMGKVALAGVRGYVSQGYFHINAGSQINITATIQPDYTACSAPSFINLSKSIADAGETVALSWSGATPGTANPITGYDIYKSTNGGAYVLLQNVPTSAASGSINITANNTQGAADKYKIVTKGTQAGYDSGDSTEVILTTRVYTAPTAPTSVVLASGIANPGAADILSWAGEGAGTNNPPAGFEIHRATVPDGPYSKIADTASSPVNVTAPATGGSHYYYKILTKGTRTGLNSGLSSAYAALRANAAPSAPVLSYPADGATIFNSLPRILLTVGGDAESQAQTVSIAGYTPSSNGTQVAGNKIVFRKTSAAVTGAQSASATSADAMGNTSAVAVRGFTFTEPTWTDNVLSGGTTRIKAVHLNEIRTAINQVRAYYGLSAYTWLENITAGLTSMASWADHVQEMRTAIEQIVSFVNAWDSTGTGHRITLPLWYPITGKRPIAAVIMQLRAVILLL